MNDPRYNKLAKLLVNYSTEVKPKDLVAITALTTTQPQDNRAILSELHQT
jgi:hypothetical protein